MLTEDPVPSLLFPESSRILVGVVGMGSSVILGGLKGKRAGPADQGLG